MKLKLKEADILKEIKDYLNYQKYFYWRNNTGAAKIEGGSFVRFGTQGSPDLFILYKGKIIGVEIKSARGQQSKEQKNFEQQMERNGGLYFLVRSIDEFLIVEGIIK